MDVRSAGAGLPIAASPRLEGNVGSLPGIGIEALREAVMDDVVAAPLFCNLVGSLPVGPVRDLLHTIETERFSPEPATLDHLLGAALAAIGRRDLPRAMAALAEYVDRDPDHASALPLAPALQPVEIQLRDLLHRVTQEAKAEAERQLAIASCLPRSATADPDTRVILAVAERMFEAGQLAAYIRASELCRRIGERSTARVTPMQDAERQRRLRDPLGRVWRRAPLLVMLLIWLATGAVLTLIFGRDAAATIWGVGFLVLVMLQFAITTRHY